MAKKSTSAQHFLECDNCEKHHAKFLCKTCIGHLCENCKTKHERTKMTRSHEIVSLISNNQNMVDLLYCKDHTKKKLECYCNRCKEPVCTDCIIQIHNGHSVESLSTVYKRITDGAKQQKEKIDNILLPKYRVLVFNETVKESALKRRAEEIKKKIEAHTESLVEMIKTIGTQTVEDLSKKEKDGLREIEQTKNNFKKQIDELRLMSRTISADIEAKPGISFFKLVERNNLERFEKFQPDIDYSLADFQPGDIKLAIENNFGIRPILQRSGHDRFVITNVPKEKLYQTEMEKETYFQILHDASCLPRFTYHRSLVDWYVEGLPKDILFTGYRLESCFIIIGGIITDEDNRMLFGETALSERLDIKDLQKEARNHTAFLIVYFFTDNFTKMGEDIEKLDRILPLKHGHGHVLVVMEMECSKDRKNIIENIMTLGISRVEVVIKRRSEIVQRITCTLEQILSSYLVGTKEILLDHSHTHKVDLSLLEVNAILKRLKQAECYPEPLVGFVEPANNEIDNILQRFPEKILYSVNDGNTQYIIASDHTTKMSLETLFSGSGFKNINFVISVEDKLSISELSKTGVPLHGAKFVYVNMGAEAFSTDECFATTGSLMQVNNNSLMVAVTCRHALDKKDSFFTLIENSMVKLGQEVKQPNNKMVRLHDDISIVRIDDATRSIVDEKCEKLLIDTSKLPSPARISDRTLVKGDIVHKRGARTGLTTGIVRDVRTQQIGRFSEQSRVIFITGRDSIPFAEKGDSGSLVFQHSLDPEGKRLEVLAMVQGKVNVPIPNADVICFPFIEGCENLQNNIPDIQNLDFFNH